MEGYIRGPDACVLMNGIALTFGVGFVMMIGFAVTGFVFFNRRKRR